MKQNSKHALCSMALNKKPREVYSCKKICTMKNSATTIFIFDTPLLGAKKERNAIPWGQ
jgi:hypothetical protein